MAAEDWIKLVAGLGGLFTFIFAIWQYQQAERWKRVQFVGQEIRAMKANPAVINVGIMLDFRSRDVCLFPEREKPVKRSVPVTQDELAHALRIYDDAMPFSEKEARIRDNFDVFLDYLEQFQQFVETGLVNIEFFRPLLVYWTDLIKYPAVELKDTYSGSVLWTYMNYYRFIYARRFLWSLGVDIPPPPENFEAQAPSKRDLRRSPIRQKFPPAPVRQDQAA